MTSDIMDVVGIRRIQGTDLRRGSFPSKSAQPFMPLIQTSSYRAPSWLPGGHAQTIYPALFRRVARVTMRAERLELADGDFIDLQWAEHGNSRLAILSHGLEADATTGYIQAMAAALIRRGWDVLAWNFRGCGGVPNRLLRMYHSGATEDLQAVISHALENHPADSIDLIGFSLGGKLTQERRLDAWSCHFVRVGRKPLVG